VVLKLGHFGKQIRNTWNVLKCGAGEVDQKYLECFEMLCCRRMEKISWNDRARNDKVLLHAVKEGKNILHAMKRRKATCVGHILHRICILM
jgi:hypothetical protein